MGLKRFDKKFGDAFLASVPAEPGVYLWRDEAGAILYVGKAKHLRRRIAQYRNAKRLKRDRKMRELVRDAATLEWEPCASELDACLRELRLIQEHRPKKNIASAFSFRYPFLGVARDEKETAFVFTAAPEAFPDVRFFGAFRSRETTIEAFFSLMRLLRFIGHATRPGARRRRDGYVFTFRRLPGGTGEAWEAFFLGETREALEALALRLLSNAGARAKAAAIQDDIDAIRRFWEEEAEPLRKCLLGTGYAVYPVPQTERDPLFLRFRNG